MPISGGSTVSAPPASPAITRRSAGCSSIPSRSLRSPALSPAPRPRPGGADPERVRAGVLLHDIGKLEAYRWDSVFEYTEAHYLIGHVTMGALRLQRVLDAQPQPVCTPEERALLLHLILAHHGRLEYGSPVMPLTLEAEAIHWADSACAKTASISEALHDEYLFGEGPASQRRFWQLDNRRPYRGTSDWGAASS